MTNHKTLKLPLMILISTFFMEASMACSCAQIPVIERFNQAEYVFSGEIIAAELQIDQDANYRSTGDKIKIKVGFRSDFKGDSSQLEYLYTNSDSSSCGIPVTIGTTHIFLVGGNGMVFSCGSTIKNDELSEFNQLLKNKNLPERR